MGLFAAMLVLLCVGFGIGLLLCAPFRRGRERLPFGASTTAIVGLCAACAVLPNLFALGAPRAAVLGVAYAAAAAGCALALRRRLAVWPDRAGVLLACAFALVFEAPIAVASTVPPLGSDAVRVWWPKVVEVANGIAPDLHGDVLEHGLPFYPRGLAWLASVAAPWSTGEGNLVRTIPVLWAWLTALAMTAIVRAHGLPRQAMLVGALFLLLPDVAQFANAGTPDLAVAAAVLVAGLGLSLRRERREGWMLAAAAACGAASIKEEGNLVLLVVFATAIVDAVRRPASRRAAIAVLAAPIVLLPFALQRAAVPQTRFDTASLLLTDPEMLVLRAAAASEQVVTAVLGGSGPPNDPESVPLAAMWCTWLALASLVVLLLPARPRPIAVLPALVLLVGAGVVYVLSSAYVGWHVRTTLPRLSVQVAPLLLVAATARWGAMAPAGLPTAVTGMSPAGPRAGAVAH
jgi:hypothetical protein